MMPPFGDGPFAQSEPITLVPSGGDDTQAIQNAISRSTNGARIRLAVGVYLISNTIHVPSNIYLEGDGIGKTVLRSTVASFPGYIPGSGVQAYAMIALVAAASSRVSGLTIDLATHSTDANGIIAVPDGASGAGTPCVDCVIADNEVLGTPNHSYQIWSQMGQHIKILRNYVNGNYAPTGNLATDPDYEGIEVMGGYDILVSGNTLINLSTGIYVWGAAGISGGDVKHVRVSENFTQNTDCGIKTAPAYSGGVSTGVYDLIIRGNQVNGALYAGILVQVAEASAIAQDLNIDGNTILGSLTGIWLDNQLASGTLTRVSVRGNKVTGASSSTLGAISAQDSSNVYMSGNIVDNSGGHGFYCANSGNLTIENNMVISAGKSAIVLNTVTDSRIAANLLQGYNALGGGTNAIPLTACASLDICSNLFSLNGSAEVYGIQSGSDSSELRMWGNRLLYIPTFATPFNNVGLHPWEFDVVIAATTASTSVAHPMAVYSGVRLRITQIAGVAQPVTATISGGNFVFTLAAATTASVTYRVEIVQ